MPVSNRSMMSMEDMELQVSQYRQALHLVLLMLRGPLRKHHNNFSNQMFAAMRDRVVKAEAEVKWYKVHAHEGKHSSTLTDCGVGQRLRGHKRSLDVPTPLE